jgi:hypothetical protein
LRANSLRCLRVGGVDVPCEEGRRGADWEEEGALLPGLRCRARDFWACERMDRNSGVRSWIEAWVVMVSIESGCWGGRGQVAWREGWVRLWCSQRCRREDFVNSRVAESMRVVTRLVCGRSGMGWRE